MSEGQNQQANLGAERAVLSGLCQYGRIGYYDVSDIITPNTFTSNDNAHIFKALEIIFKDVSKVDIPTLTNTLIGLGWQDLHKDKKRLEYIRSLFNFPIEQENIRNVHAKTIAKLALIRDSMKSHMRAYKELSSLDGQAPMDEIVTISEKVGIDMMKKLNGEREGTKLIGTSATDFIQNLMDNPCDTVGIPLPFGRMNPLIGGGVRRGGVTLMAMRPKVGKAQPLHSKILTPTGFVEMKDIKIGDRVSHPNGGWSHVTDIFPQGKKPIYRFSFSDGTSTMACKEHLWKVKSRRWNDYRVMSFEDMEKTKIKEEDRYKWQMPIADAIYFDSSRQYFSPYILGCLIGDGAITESVRFTSFDKEIVSNIEKELVFNHYISVHKKDGNYSIIKDDNVRANFYWRSICDFGLNVTSHDKFIPNKFLYSSVENRKALLQGLMDTDGYVDERGNLEFTTVSKRLSEDFCFLVKSLGGVCKVVYRSTTYNGVDKFYSYRIRLSFNDNRIAFRLNRKLVRCHKRTKPNLKRKLESVEYVGDMEAQCITVSANDGLYITDDFVVTHNSTTATETSLFLAKEHGIPILILDTEMTEDDQVGRMICNLSKVNIEHIETGKCGQFPDEREKVLEASRLLEGLPIYYRGVGGKSFKNILSIIRQWIFSEVGFNEDGRTNECLVIYDYFKLMDKSDLDSMQEYQAMGYQVSDMADFAKAYDFPCLAFVQVNRDGVTKETSDILSQSDRLLWLCTSVTLIKEKSAEEISQDGIDNGNLKMIVLDTRFGPGMSDGDYINIQRDGEYATIREVSSKSELNKAKNERFKNDSGFDNLPG